MSFFLNVLLHMEDLIMSGNGTDIKIQTLINIPMSYPVMTPLHKVTVCSDQCHCLFLAFLNDTVKTARRQVGILSLKREFIGSAFTILSSIAVIKHDEA